MRKLEELLADYRSGLLSPEEKKFVEAELRKNPDLLQEAKGYAAAWEVVRHQVNIDTKEKLKAQLLADEEFREEYEEERMRNAIEKKKGDIEDQNSGISRWGIIALVAASFALIFVLFFSVSKYLSSQQEPIELTSYDQILAEPTYKSFINNLLGVQAGNRGIDRIITNSEFKATDSTLFALFKQDSLNAVISYLLNKNSTSELWSKDSLSLAIAYYHIREYNNSLLLLEELVGPEIPLDIKRWYLARNYLQLKQLGLAKNTLCEMREYHDFQDENVRQLLDHLKFSCP